MDAGLDALLRHPGIWRVGRASGSVTAVIPTGLSELDEKLPGGGWPAQGLIELLMEQPGVFELGLLLPALAELHARSAKNWLALVTPPHEPYAPALATAGLDLSRLLIVRTTQSLWTMEQMLISGACRAVLGWVDRQCPVSMPALLRLQFTAVANGSLCILCRPLSADRTPSPAKLRLALLPQAARLSLEILKCQGGHPGSVVLAKKMT